MPGATATQIYAAYPKAGYDVAVKLVAIAKSLGVPDPAMLANVIDFESGHSWNPAARNPAGGATGLIQFYPRGTDGHVNDAIGAGLGVTTSQLAAMTALQQLAYVEQYFKPYAGKLLTADDVYMAVYWPAAIGKGRSYAFPSSTWAQNPGIKTAGDYIDMANRYAKLTPTTALLAVGAVGVGTLVVVPLLLVAFGLAGYGAARLYRRAGPRRNPRRRRWAR